MPEILKEKQLFELLLSAIDDSGWHAIAVERRKPFLFRAYRPDESQHIDLRIYIWNCTHGGGEARASDEYRIQITSVVPKLHAGEIALLLGWHSGYGVFVGFDISKHAGQASASPSIQIKESALVTAHARSFSAYDRANGEVAVAFRPEFLIDYATNAFSLHRSAGARSVLEVLNEIDTVREDEIEKIRDTKRKLVVSTIKRKYREHDFRNRVLTAYTHHCAMCGIQLKLVEAAHILPVASEKSTDDTNNGISLCKLHHAAFDQNLISFNEKYQTEISSRLTERLVASRLAGGLTEFKRQIKPAILLPADKRDYPDPFFIKEARRVRTWIE